MQRIKYAVVLAAILLGTLAVSGQSAGAGQAGNAATQPNVLRILTPKPGQKFQQDFVTVKLELTDAAASASGMPNFQLRLDSRDPVTTTSNEYTFTGLAPGPHTVQVQLVDANNTPIAGAQSTVQFVVIRSSSMRQAPKPTAIAAAMRVDQRDNHAGADRKLPSASGALPLLSVIGFGVLLGGIASAMKTR